MHVQFLFLKIPVFNFTIDELYRCHHTDEAHVTTAESDSILKRGKCMIPSCTCKQYSDAIEKIDEELL